jgi:hypothetical protein
MKVPNEYKDICDMLLQATQEGRVKWVDKQGTMTVCLADFDLEMWSGTDERDTEFVAMGLRDPQSKKLIDSWYVESGQTDFEMMRDLFAMARRQTGGIAEGLQKLRELLRSGETIGVVASESLVIESALYGAGEKTVDVTHILRSKIESGKINNFPVTNQTMGGDPIVGVGKTLTIKYSYMGQSRSISISEGSKVSLPV